MASIRVAPPQTTLFLLQYFTLIFDGRLHRIANHSLLHMILRTVERALEEDCY
jgi:hypothetical protein